MVAADGTPLRSPRTAAPRPRPRAGLAGLADAPYRGADPTVSELTTWTPGLTGPSTSVLVSREQLADRTRDLVRNHGWAAGAVSRYVDRVIGSQFRPRAWVDARALGLTAEDAAAVELQMEAAWRRVAEDPRHLFDAAMEDSASTLLGQVFRDMLVEGDGFALLGHDPARRRAGGGATFLQPIHPARVSNPMGEPTRAGLRGGIAYDRRGAPIAYHIARAHPAEVYWDRATGALIHDRVPARTRWGRRVVLHTYDAAERGQGRGVPRFAPVLREARMLERYSTAELSAAVINALLAAYIETPLGPEAVQSILDGTEAASGVEAYRQLQSDYHAANQVTLDGVQISQLYPGERIGVLQAHRPAAQYDVFTRSIQAHLAQALQGLSLEQFTLDYSKTNYSAARGGMTAAAVSMIADRGRFQARIATPIWLAVIEEAIDQGWVRLPAGAPGLFEAYGAWTRVRWIGPGEAWVDPLKEAQAVAARLEAGITTLEQECARLGLDWEEVLDQRARENERLAALGLAAGDLARSLSPAAQAEDRAP